MSYMFVRWCECVHYREGVLHWIDVSWCIEIDSILRLYDFVSIKTHIEEDIYWWESKDVPSI